MQPLPLVNAKAGAKLLGIGLRAFHLARKRPDFPAEIRISAKTVRWRPEALLAWAASLESRCSPPEPPQLAEGRSRRLRAHGAATPAHGAGG